MTRYEEYKAGEIDSRRVEGTAIGKAAVREFVRGLELRHTSEYEHPLPQDLRGRIAYASWYFHKWLAEIPGYGAEPNQSVRILVAYEDSRGNVLFDTNIIEPVGTSDWRLSVLGLWRVIWYMVAAVIKAACAKLSLIQRMRYGLQWAYHVWRMSCDRRHRRG